LQWNPDVATQLVVASDEDGSPSLRVQYSYCRSYVFLFQGLYALTLYEHVDPALGYEEYNFTNKGVYGTH